MKITRATQLLFGSTGVVSDFGEFGSLAAGTPTTTKTPSVIQSLSAWGLGWAYATIGSFVPAYQDMNSVCYLAFYQICYILQMGLAEYDAGTTYYTNSVAQYNGQFYVSLVDNNTGNEPDISPTQWQSGLPGAEITGVIKIFAGVSAPHGYLMCNGSAVSRTTYAALFAIVGTIYGAGDGMTTFNLPNMQGNVPVGYLPSDPYFGVLGGTGGEEEHTLTINEMPAHSHEVEFYNSGGGVGPQVLQQNNSPNPFYTNNTGGGAAHNNVQPYLTVNFIIKT